MTWTAAQKTEIPNTASVQVLALSDGRWVFIGNDIDDGRYQISLYLSDDEGKTWKWKTYLEQVEKGDGRTPNSCSWDMRLGRGLRC